MLKKKTQQLWSDWTGTECTQYVHIVVHPHTKPAYCDVCTAAAHFPKIYNRQFPRLTLWKRDCVVVFIYTQNLQMNLHVKKNISVVI